MRYQPAYIYKDTKRSSRHSDADHPALKIHNPRAAVDEGNMVQIARFAMVVIGMLLFVIGLAHVSTAQMAKGWDKVTATITSADILRMNYEDGKPVFTAKLEYQFIKDGTLHSGSAIAIRPIRSHSPGEVKRMISPYKVGRTVVAMVNPDNAAEAYLKTDPMAYLYALTLPGLFLLGLSFAIGRLRYLNAERQRRNAWRFGQYDGPAAFATA